MSNISNNVIINANDLKKTDIQKREIKSCVLEVLKRINEELQAEHSNGNYFLITDIPIIYDISNMSIARGQQIVWSSLIEILEEKKYRVWINYSKDNCRLKISWISEQEESELKRQQDIIKKHYVRNF